MSAIRDLSITLEYDDIRVNVDKQKQFYRPGDFMEGVVVLSLNTSLRVRDLRINVVGSAYTSWEVQSRRKTYEETEWYLDYKESLMKDGMTDKTFPKGHHRFAFRFQLSPDLPSTFHGTFGSVTYAARASLEAEDESQNTVSTQPFVVLRRDPLPAKAYEPVAVSKKKTFIGLQTGKVEVKGWLDHGIAVPGKKLNVNAEVVNMCGKDITLLQGALVCDSTFFAKGKQVSFRQYLNKRQDFFDVNLQWGRRWRDVKIQVPPHLPDSRLFNCNIIDIKYRFQFKVCIKGQPDIIIETPLYVGYHQDMDPMYDSKALLMDRMMNGAPSPYNSMDRMKNRAPSPYQSMDRMTNGTPSPYNTSRKMLMNEPWQRQSNRMLMNEPWQQPMRQL